MSIGTAPETMIEAEAQRLLSDPRVQQLLDGLMDVTVGVLEELVGATDVKSSPEARWVSYTAISRVLTQRTWEAWEAFYEIQSQS
ncbi:hypothetical protein [Streptomyces sp. CBMA29]|uniref:hypothetical protein n=1 Tax=Streptomyces sp. CBMA29 TaxID=1896314 RepID=UPI001661A285|nr:hypothetical protein [Streptomyces sp. CBMA29]MBD0734012.1 hypothetical protein [Streptomyces sp. CBMA29]